MLETVTLLAGIISVIAQLGFFTQAYKMYKHKKSDSISVLTYFLFFPNFIIWLIYGFITHQTVVMLPNIVALIGCGLVVGLYYKYKPKRAADTQ